MMIVVLVLSGIIIGATAVGGLMMVRQTRQTTDAGASSKTIFAADAGLEWRMYKFILDDYRCIDCPDGNQCDQIPQFEKNNNVEVRLTTTCAKQSEDKDFNYYLVSSTGKAGNSSYIFNEQIRVVK